MRGTAVYRPSQCFHWQRKVSWRLWSWLNDIEKRTIIYWGNQGNSSPKPMMHIAYSSHISSKFINTPIFLFFFVFLASPSLTIMHLHVMLNRYWMPMEVAGSFIFIYSSFWTSSNSSLSSLKHFLHCWSSSTGSTTEWQLLWGKSLNTIQLLNWVI